MKTQKLKRQNWNARHAAFEDKNRVTTILVLCNFGNMPKQYAKEIISEYRKRVGVKMRYLNHNRNGAELTLINQN
jgi:hypothetical protein